MEIINSQVTGDITVSSDTQYNNVFADNVIVLENVTTRLYGEINNDITINKGSILYLHGKHHGKIIDNGGTIHIYTNG